MATLDDVATLLPDLRRLIDEDAIRQLQFEYARLMDDGFCSGDFDAEALAALWTEDGVWHGDEANGRHVGRAAIATFFRHHATEVPFANHYATNAQVTVTGDTAFARTLLLVPVTFLVDGAPSDQWMFVAWRNRFARIAGRWFFTELTAHVFKAGTHLAGADLAQALSTSS